MSVGDYHIPDIIICIILGVLWFYLDKRSPNKMFVPEKDSQSSYPYKNTGLKGSFNLLIVLSVPSVTYVIIYLIIKFGEDVKTILPFNLFEVLVCHFGCIFFAGIICHVLKIRVGRPRPDFYDLTQDRMQEHKDPEKLVREAYKSFPSGHSCTSASGCLFFSLILIRVIKGNKLWSICLKLIPLGYSFYIGSMRITEYRHHVDDVIGGLLIGFLISYIVYHAISINGNTVLFP